jgi:hypothetical protein
MKMGSKTELKTERKNKNRQEKNKERENDNKKEKWSEKIVVCQQRKYTRGNTRKKVREER